MSKPQSISVSGLILQFDAQELTSGTPEQQAACLIVLINEVLRRETLGLQAQIMKDPERPFEINESEVCEICGGEGWLIFDVGDNTKRDYRAERCDTCEKYPNDHAAEIAHGEEINKRIKKLIDEDNS